MFPKHDQRSYSSYLILESYAKATVRGLRRGSAFAEMRHASIGSRTAPTANRMLSKVGCVLRRTWKMAVCNHLDNFPYAGGRLELGVRELRAVSGPAEQLEYATDPTTRNYRLQCARILKAELVIYGKHSLLVGYNSCTDSRILDAYGNRHENCASSTSSFAAAPERCMRYGVSYYDTVQQEGVRHRDHETTGEA
ncbi:uncharacterized protein EI97DRAFT_440337 [Westerdykella ornata]|uniref:Uncharacterized protein n=1 Tax=Westerdykella ornata TaxID=318751 RepID=A0A6A6JQB8_WESOR|nr:uncharacterized protein EI97DRAFT_440337 [Westerdykella ornata]KAF2278821.1 hypothetical protein EI97DRAFT_440337 [Westerdykella ornata]